MIFSIRDVLSLIFKRKWVILVFFLSMLTGVFLALKLVAPTYAATAKILVKVGREDIYVPALPTSAVTRPMISLIREEQLNSEVEILTSESLAEKLIEAVSPEGIYPAMFVKHPWYTPKGVMQGLIGLYKALDGYFAPLTADLSKEQRVMKRLLKKDLKVEGTGDSNVIAVTVYNKIPDLAAQTANNLVDLYLTERGRIHSGMGGDIFEQQLQDIENRLEESQYKLQNFRESNDLMDAGDERATLLQRISDIRSTIVSLQADPAAARRLSKWRHELKQVEGQLETLSNQELEYVRLMQDVEVLKKSRKLYLEKLEEQRINTALSNARIGNVSVISNAVPPSSPVTPKLWMLLAAALFVGLAGGVGLAVLLEFLDDTLETDQDVKKHLGLPVLGKIGVM